MILLVLYDFFKIVGILAACWHGMCIIGVNLNIFKPFSSGCPNGPYRGETEIIMIWLKDFRLNDIGYSLFKHLNPEKGECVFVLIPSRDTTVVTGVDSDSEIAFG